MSSSEENIRTAFSVGHHVRIHWGEMQHPPAVASSRRLGLENFSDDLHNRRRLRHRDPLEMQMRQILWQEPGGFPVRLSLPRLPRVILSSDPLFGESFCTCYKDKGRELSCYCGESDSDFDWVWDTESKSSATQLENENREVRFHMEYSCGTAAVRGNRPMLGNQYYWEIKMTTPVYGTDMMVGVGTTEADLDRCRDSFCSLLGSDCESWGLSYTGLFYHQGKAQCYAPRFGQGSIIGIHLDMWNGTLSFYKNRRSLGVACKGLKGKTLYPMVSSTAARSGMKVIRSRSFNSSLQYLCCLKLREMIPSDQGVLDAVSLPPGLMLFLQNNLEWLLGPTTSSTTHCCRCQSSKQAFRKFSACHSCSPDLCNNSSAKCNTPDGSPTQNTKTNDSEKNLRPSVHIVQWAESSASGTHSPVHSYHAVQQSNFEAGATALEHYVMLEAPGSESATSEESESSWSTNSEGGTSSDEFEGHSATYSARRGSQSAKRKHSSSGSEESLSNDDVPKTTVRDHKRQPCDSL